MAEIKDVVKARRKKIENDIDRLVTGRIAKEYRELAQTLLYVYPAEDVVAGLLNQQFGNVLDASSYKPLKPAKKQKRGRTLVEEEGKTRLIIAKGRSQKMTKKKLVDFIVKKAGTSQRLIENIEINKDFSFITVPFAEAEIILRKFRKKKVAKRPVVLKVGDRKKSSRPGRKNKKKQ